MPRRLLHQSWNTGSTYDNFYFAQLFKLSFITNMRDNKNMSSREERKETIMNECMDGWTQCLMNYIHHSARDLQHCNVHAFVMKTKINHHYL